MGAEGGRLRSRRGSVAVSNTVFESRTPLGRTPTGEGNTRPRHMKRMERDITPKHSRDIAR